MKRSHRLALSIPFTLSLIFLIAAQRREPRAAASTSVDDWPVYGHDPGGMKYSPLRQINRGNVNRLQVAWTFHTGDVSDGSGGRQRSGFENTPILVDGTPFSAHSQSGATLPTGRRLTAN